MLCEELLNLFTEQLDDRSGIMATVLGDTVILQGTVSCPLMKLLAEDLAYSRPEVRDCLNELAIVTDSDSRLVA